MTFFEHANILRKHLWFSVIIIIIGFTVSLVFYDHLITILITPLKSASTDFDSRLYLTTVYEGLMARIRISLTAGIFLTLPVHIINFMIFLFPALTVKEKKTAASVIASGFILTLVSLIYSFRYLVPFSIAYMTGSGMVTEGTSFLLGFTGNIFYLIQFITAVVVIFQIPLIVFLLISLKIISVKSAFTSGRYMILSAFVLSAVLTPPDYVSQIMTAVPLIFLYYLSLLIAKLLHLGAR